MKNLPKLVHQPRRGQHDINRQPKKFKKLTLSCGRTITMHNHQSRPHLYRQPTLPYHQPVVYYYPPSAAVQTSPIVVKPRRTNCSQVDNRGLCMNNRRKLYYSTSKRGNLCLNVYSQSKDKAQLLLQENKPKKSLRSQQTVILNSRQFNIH